MLQNFLVVGLAGLLGIGAVVADVPTGGVAIAQTVDDRKEEADRFLEQGKEQFRG